MPSIKQHDYPELVCREDIQRQLEKQAITKRLRHKQAQEKS